MWGTDALEEEDIDHTWAQVLPLLDSFRNEPMDFHACEVQEPVFLKNIHNVVVLIDENHAWTDLLSFIAIPVRTILRAMRNSGIRRCR